MNYYEYEHINVLTIFFKNKKLLNEQKFKLIIGVFNNV